MSDLMQKGQLHSAITLSYESPERTLGLLKKKLSKSLYRIVQSVPKD